MPRGRVCEVFGAPSAGKTTLALHVIASAQATDGLAGFVDAEHAFDPTYAERLGVVLPDLVVAQPDSGEQAFDILVELIESGSLDVIVVDSVAALVPQDELAGGEVDIAGQARMMSEGLSRLSGSMRGSRTLVLFVNQLRTRIEAEHGPPETTPGGRALRLHAAVRVELKTAGAILADGEQVGSRVVARVVKNQLAPPFLNAEFDILFGRGIETR